MHRSVPTAALALSLIAIGCGGGDSTSVPAPSSSTSTTTAEPAETTEFLGAMLAAATAGEPGVVVVAVASGSESRLRAGDVIVEAEGKPVTTPQELIEAVGEPDLGGRFTIKVVRGSRRFMLTEIQSPTAFLGTEVQDAPKGEPGVAVVGVAAGSPAEKAGIQAGDLIVAIDGKPVASGDDLLQAVGAHSPGDEVAVTISREGQRSDLSVTLIRNPGASG